MPGIKIYRSLMVKVAYESLPSTVPLGEPTPGFWLIATPVGSLTKVFNFANLSPPVEPQRVQLHAETKQFLYFLLVQ
jgi:hypothetical protein